MGGDIRDENDEKDAKGGGVHWCAIFIGLIIVIAIIVVVLAFTVFRVRDPEVTINTIQLTNYVLKFPGPVLSFTLIVSVNVKNRNHASFNYRDSRAFVFYHGLNIGSAFISAGKVKASSTSTISSVVTIDASSFVGDPNLPTDLSAGAVPFVVTTTLPGKIDVLNIVKHDATSTVKCSFSLFPQSASVGAFNCNSKLNL
ncbi:hypothetical protein R1flu_006756 [Riccia fluitans]|uniref:Late embryogenesis abundant protein LEA-2 subgroup domain-containing protein n=1 Tax=Riccia fluitans TaxID=41844 RepID=A0ABD1YZY2_9MARC